MQLLVREPVLEARQVVVVVVVAARRPAAHPRVVGDGAREDGRRALARAVAAAAVRVVAVAAVVDVEADDGVVEALGQGLGGGAGAEAAEVEVLRLARVEGRGLRCAGGEDGFAEVDFVGWEGWFGSWEGRGDLQSEMIDIPGTSLRGVSRVNWID
jgi:hypothetical protein